jgi:sugar/nucleoside kinase (ribokinase family)
MSSMDTGTTYDVLLQGNPFCDLTFTFLHLESVPVLGQEVFADDFDINPGGIFNIASALARLKLRVGLKAVLGNDMFSTFVAHCIREADIDMRLVSHLDAPRPVVTAGISLPHDRLFISYAPPGREIPGDLAISIADLERYRPRCVFSYGDLSLDVYRAARRASMLTVVDAFWDTRHLRSDALRATLAEIDIFAPNLAEALEVTGESTPQAALEQLSRLCRAVVIKCGDEGCIAARGPDRYSVPAISVHCRDTTGAGDNFNAGLIYGVLRGYSFEKALRCAVITGGLSTAVLGGCRSGYTETDVETRLSTHEGGMQVS